jgi:crossover junction endodeoxyribonuclease RuvC
VLDGAKLAEKIKNIHALYPINHAIIEHVSSAPGAGVSTSFSFGKTTGMTIGVLCGLKIPYLSIHPAVWKKTFGLSTNKDDSRFKAVELFPDARGYFARKKDHNRAEAALLAVHGEAFI